MHHLECSRMANHKLKFKKDTIPMICNMSTPLTVYKTLQIKFPIPLVKWVHVPHEKEGKLLIPYYIVCRVSIKIL